MKAKERKKNKKLHLEADEQALLDSFEHGEWKSVNALPAELKKAKTIAVNTLRKDARITLRISSRDLLHLKEKAAYKGLPYQTFISSVLHEYIAGHGKNNLDE